MKCGERVEDRTRREGEAPRVEHGVVMRTSLDGRVARVRPMLRPIDLDAEPLYKTVAGASSIAAGHKPSPWD